MKQSMSNSAVPAAVLRKLHLVRKRTMLVHVASALVAAAAVLLAAMGIAMLIDWLATLYDSRWRLVLTATALIAAVATSIGWIILAWRRALRLEQVAAEVDRQVPRLEERWTTMTRLGEDAAKPNVIHPAMLRRLSLEAASWEPRIEPENVVSLSSLMRTMLALTAITAVLALAVVLNTREVLVLAHRFLMPGSSISATKLVNVPGDLVIARGEPLALNAAIEGTPVENATLFLQPEAKAPQTIMLVAERQEPIGFSHRMRAVEEPFAYRFRAGDGQTEWFNVDVADRPEIDRIKFTVTPPAYTRQPAKTFEKLPERVSALRNSRVEIAVRPKVPVASAHLKLDNNRSAPMPLGSDGWFRWTTTLNESCSFTPILTEQHGLTNRRAPKCQLIAYEDQPPTVKVLSPDDKTAVRPDDTFPITFSATDDVGIGSAELVVYQENGSKDSTQLADIPIELGKQQGSRSVQQTVDLDLKKFGAKDGTELSFEIRVREDRGEASEQASSQTTSQNSSQNKTSASSPAGAAKQSAPQDASGNKIAKQSPAMAGRESKKGETANEPQTTTTASATPTKSLAANSATSQTSSSPMPKGQKMPSATGQARRIKQRLRRSKKCRPNRILALWPPTRMQKRSRRRRLRSRNLARNPRRGQLNNLLRRHHRPQKTEQHRRHPKSRLRCRQGRQLFSLPRRRWPIQRHRRRRQEKIRQSRQNRAWPPAAGSRSWRAANRKVASHRQTPRPIKRPTRVRPLRITPQLP